MIKKEWFYNKSEGYLGDNEQVKVLFIMCEPSSGGEEVKEGKFWFFDVINQNQRIKWKKREARYFDVLGRIACLLLSEDDKFEALKQCAYVNLYPKKGEGHKSACYYCQLCHFIEGKDEYHRWDIIDNLPKDSIIVTMGDIAKAIEKVKRDSISDSSDEVYLSNLDKHFQSFTFMNHSGEMIRVYSIPHPNPKNKKRDGFDECDIRLSKR